MIRWLKVHLQRLGCPLSAPRFAARRLLEDPKTSLTAIIGWLCILSVALAPDRLGHALLISRVDLWAGFGMLVQGIFQRTLDALLVAGGLGIVLYGILRSRPSESPSLDRVLDLVSYALVPYLFLASAGAIFSFGGLEFLALPHRSLRSAGVAPWIRFTVGFGPSVLLIFLWGFQERKSRTPEVCPDPETR